MRNVISLNQDWKFIQQVAGASGNSAGGLADCTAASHMECH